MTRQVIPCVFLSLFSSVGTGLSVYRDKYTLGHYAAAGGETRGRQCCIKDKKSLLNLLISLAQAFTARFHNGLRNNHETLVSRIAKFGHEKFFFFKPILIKYDFVIIFIF